MKRFNIFIFVFCVLNFSCDINTKKNFYVQDVELNVFDFLNDHRKEIGLSEIKWSDDAFEQCNIHSKNMANERVSFGHDGFDERLKKIGCVVGCENVAMNYSEEPAVVVNMWLNSPGHKNNIENATMNYGAVSCAKSKGGALYWTMIFFAS